MTQLLARIVCAIVGHDRPETPEYLTIEGNLIILRPCRRGCGATD